MWMGLWCPAMQRALFAAYPTVTVINIADVLDTIQGFVGQINGVVRFLAGFSMLSGAIILASSVASTRFRRIREVVVLKTLGAQAESRRKSLQHGVSGARTSRRNCGRDLREYFVASVATPNGGALPHRLGSHAFRRLVNGYSGDRYGMDRKLSYPRSEAVGGASGRVGKPLTTHTQPLTMFKEG